MKPWYRSRTLIVNAVAAGLVALEAGTGGLQPLLPVDMYAALAVALPVLNAILRVVTTQALNVAPASSRLGAGKDAGATGGKA